MKRSALVVALGITMSFCALADQTAVTNAVTKSLPANKTGVAEKSASKAKKTELTGSYIKREIRRNGQITDGPNPVLVIDSRAIQNSGAADLRQLLVRQGASR